MMTLHTLAHTLRPIAIAAMTVACIVRVHRENGPAERAAIYRRMILCTLAIVVAIMLVIALIALPFVH